MTEQAKQVLRREIAKGIYDRFDNGDRYSPDGDMTFICRALREFESALTPEPRLNDEMRVMLVELVANIKEDFGELRSDDDRRKCRMMIGYFESLLSPSAEPTEPRMFGMDQFDKLYGKRNEGEPVHLNQQVANVEPSVPEAATVDSVEVLLFERPSLTAASTDVGVASGQIFKTDQMEELINTILATLSQHSPVPFEENKRWLEDVMASEQERIRAEAFEEAAKMCDYLCYHSPGELAQNIRALAHQPKTKE